MKKYDDKKEFYDNMFDELTELPLNDDIYVYFNKNNDIIDFSTYHKDNYEKLNVLELMAILRSFDIKNNKASASIIQVIIDLSDTTSIVNFAKKSELTLRSVENWIYGKSKPNIDAFIKLANVSNIPSDLLFKTYEKLTKRFN